MNPLDYTEAEVERVSKLAKLRLTDSEKQRLAEEMQKILEFVSLLSEADTESLHESGNCSAPQLPLREDKAELLFDRQQMLMNSATVTDGYITVPRVIE
ncbi:MAG: Asp-tRNA(Asn)/Glu-tRNA(Gln) amidotransferase subunit GatC [Clostridia bacterium]|nr:Asp-tRNA(Asn)/Glu-tRNA(Gln) amidotransferase subunit GatC [Clostridia bacterium]